MPYYSGRGDCLYGRGDYYRGDYYRGDPFIHKKIGGALKSIAGVAVNLLPGPVGAVARTVLGGIQRPAAQGFAEPPLRERTRIQLLPPRFEREEFGPDIDQMGLPQQPVGSMTPQGLIPGCQLKGYRPNKSSYYKRASQGTGILIPKGSVCVKSRRMNPTNGRALRKALTRAYAFKKIALRTIRLVDPKKKAKSFAGFKKKGR